MIVTWSYCHSATNGHCFCLVPGFPLFLCCKAEYWLLLYLWSSGFFIWIFLYLCNLFSTCNDLLTFSTLSSPCQMQLVLLWCWLLYIVCGVPRHYHERKHACRNEAYHDYFNKPSIATEESNISAWHTQTTMREQAVICYEQRIWLIIIAFLSPLLENDEACHFFALWAMLKAFENIVILKMILKFLITILIYL